MDEKTVIYSAYKLDQVEIESIIAKFPFIKIENIDNVVDKTVLAGVVIYHGSQVIDISLRGRVNSLKKKLYATVK